MPIASPEVYAEMLDRAKAGAFAYPAINVTSSQTLNAALQGFAEAGSDGIVQISTGGAEYVSGPTVKNMVTGAVALAEFAHRGRQELPDQHRAAHRPLPEEQARRVRPPAARHLQGARRATARRRCSSRTCGTARPCRSTRTCRSPRSCWPQAAAAHIILEIEVGVVGGEEDGVSAAIDDKLYSTVEDGLATAAALGLGEKGRYMTALTFGNVHGVYKPGNVKLRPEILKEIQEAVGAKYGKEKPFDLVFHGGSGSLLSEIHGALDFGVVKMNIDTDTQYAFTRPVADHMFKQLRRRAEDRRRGRQQEGRTTRAPGASWPRTAWPSASSRPASTCARRAPRLASNSIHGQRPVPLRGTGRSSLLQDHAAAWVRSSVLDRRIGDRARHRGL